MNTRTLAAFTLSLALVGGTAFAQQTNEADRRDAQANTRQDQRADKSQAKADKDANKALKSKKVKKAVHSQDKADQQAAKTPDR